MQGRYTDTRKLDSHKALLAGVVTCGGGRLLEATEHRECDLVNAIYPAPSKRPKMFVKKIQNK